MLARDSAGAEQPLPVVAERLAAEVKRERELLTDRERTLFEEHLLGELGDALRARQAEAADLVHGMNELLGGVTTSQGIRVRLDWSLREDAGGQVREAVDLLGRPRGALSPDEQSRLQRPLRRPAGRRLPSGRLTSRRPGKGPTEPGAPAGTEQAWVCA